MHLSRPCLPAPLAEVSGPLQNLDALRRPTIRGEILLVFIGEPNILIRLQPNMPSDDGAFLPISGGSVFLRQRFIEGTKTPHIRSGLGDILTNGLPTGLTLVAVVLSPIPGREDTELIWASMIADGFMEDTQVTNQFVGRI